MEWFVPGVPPTHKPVDIEIDIIVVVQFRDGKIACERIYWDQATVLRQVGLLEVNVPQDHRTPYRSSQGGVS
jgi:carboxymethylenebutenolidase